MKTTVPPTRSLSDATHLLRVESHRHYLGDDGIAQTGTTTSGPLYLESCRQGKGTATNGGDKNGR